VECELKSGEIASHAHRKAPCEKSLGESRIVFEENMGVCQYGQHYFLKNRFLSHNYFLDLADDALTCTARILYPQPFQAPIKSTASSIIFILAAPVLGGGPSSIP